MSPRQDGTLLFPKVDDDEPSTRSLDGQAAPISSSPRSTSGVLGAFVRRQSTEPPVQVYERPVEAFVAPAPPPLPRFNRALFDRQARAAGAFDAFQKVR